LVVELRLCKARERQAPSGKDSSQSSSRTTSTRFLVVNTYLQLP
jgi:hypothetical protein